MFRLCINLLEVFVGHSPSICNVHRNGISSDNPAQHKCTVHGLAEYPSWLFTGEAVGDAAMLEDDVRGQLVDAEPSR